MSSPEIALNMSELLSNNNRISDPRDYIKVTGTRILHTDTIIGPVEIFIRRVSRTPSPLHGETDDYDIKIVAQKKQ